MACPSGGGRGGEAHVELTETPSDQRRGVSWEVVQTCFPLVYETHLCLAPSSGSWAPVFGSVLESFPNRFSFCHLSVKSTVRWWFLGAMLCCTRQEGFCLQAADSRPFLKGRQLLCQKCYFTNSHEAMRGKGEAKSLWFPGNTRGWKGSFAASGEGGVEKGGPWRPCSWPCGRRFAQDRGLVASGKFDPVSLTHPQPALVTVIWVPRGLYPSPS